MMSLISWLFIISGWYHWWIESQIEITATMFILAAIYNVGGHVINELRP